MGRLGNLESKSNILVFFLHCSTLTCIPYVPALANALLDLLEEVAKKEL